MGGYLYIFLSACLLYRLDLMFAGLPADGWLEGEVLEGDEFLSTLSGGILIWAGCGGCMDVGSRNGLGCDLFHTYIDLV